MLMTHFILTGFTVSLLLRPDLCESSTEPTTQTALVSHIQIVGVVSHGLYVDTLGINGVIVNRRGVAINTHYLIAPLKIAVGRTQTGRKQDEKGRKRDANRTVGTLSFFLQVGL